MTHLLVIAAAGVLFAIGSRVALSALHDAPEPEPFFDAELATITRQPAILPLEMLEDHEFGPWDRQAQLEFWRDLDSLPTCAEVRR